MLLKRVQEHPERLAPSYFESPPEIVSLNVIDGFPLLIIREKWIVEDPISGEPVEAVNYSLFTTRGHTEWHPDSELISIGDLKFRQFWDDHDSIGVVDARIGHDYRGRGIGKYIYKTAINDLLDQRYSYVFSDETDSRSLDAERVWESLDRSNPNRIREERLDNPDDERWYATGYVQRRPVRVRGHWRRSP